MEEPNQSYEGSIEPGEKVYDDDGRMLGRVTSFTDEGFEIEQVDDPDDTEELPGQEFGEGYLMWRCDDCGEMGDLDDGMPDACPVCDAPREAIEKIRED
jgi:rubrerythrin